jgi:hypothetical protein
LRRQSCTEVCSWEFSAFVGVASITTLSILADIRTLLGFITFCPEWLVGNINLDTSNFMYKWVFLVFFNTIWVWLPLYAIYVACTDIFDAFKVRAAATGTKKTK